jgi:hypothetical protein
MAGASSNYAVFNPTYLINMRAQQFQIVDNYIETNFLRN